MKDINIDKYFSDNKECYNSKYLKKVLEKIYGKSFIEIRTDVNNKRVEVTPEQIEEYLEQKFIEEDPELKKRLESPKPKRSSNVCEWTEKEIKESARRFADELASGRYYFEPYTLEYFNRYTEIVRDKINTLLNIVHGLANKDVDSIKELIDDLDIRMTANGDLTKDDMIRIIVPIIANINVLEEKIEKANDLSTYLTFKMSQHSLLRDGWSESEVYPMRALQTKSDMNDFKSVNVKLSDRQKKILKKEQRENGRIVADILTRLD